MKKKQNSKKSRNEILRIRYQVYRKLGYNSATSRFLSQRKLDVTELQISEKTGKLKRNKTTSNYIKEKLPYLKKKEMIDNHQKKAISVKNDTNFTRHGLLTHDKRYKGETAKIVGVIKNEHKLTTNQAYYFYYYMVKNKLSYEKTKKSLLTKEDFEKYEERKRQRELAKKQERIREKTLERVRSML